MIDLGHKAVLCRLPVLAHHDDWTSIRSLEGKHQVQKNERVRVPVVDPGGDVQDDPDGENDALDDDKGPGANRVCDTVCNSLAQGQAFLFHFVHIAADHRPKDPVVVMQATAQLHHNVDGSMRM